MELHALKKNAKTKEFDKEVVIVKILELCGSPEAIYYFIDNGVLDHDYINNFKL